MQWSILIYAIASTIIVIIFISLSKHLLCSKLNKSALESQNNSHNNSNTNHRFRGASSSNPSSIVNSNHNRAHSVSSVVDIARIIPTPSNITISIPNDTSKSTTTNTNTYSTPHTLTTRPTISMPKNTDINSNINMEKPSSNPSHTRSESYSIQIRASLPHAVTNLVYNIKGILHKMEYKGYESNEIQLIVRISSISAVFGFLLCVVMLSIHFIIEINNIQSLIKILCLIVYNIGKFSLYILLGSRLYYSLESSIYQYNIIVYTFITIYLIIDFVIVISAILLVYVGSFYTFSICLIIFYFMDIFYLTLLYILFTKQLISLIRNTSTCITSVLPTVQTTDIAIELQMSSSSSPSPASIPVSADSDSNNNNNKSRPSLNTIHTKDNAYINKHKVSGIEYVTKYSVLIVWSVISSLLMIVLISILNTDFILKFNEKIIIHIIISMDCIVNSFAIYLYFIFGRAIYKLFCGVCHNITSKICDKFIVMK